MDSNLVLLNDGSITRIPDNPHHRPTAIDLSFISPSLFTNCSWETYLDALGSDHLPIVITLSITNESNVSSDNTHNVVPKYDYKKADWDKFHSIIASYNFHPDYTEDDSMDINDQYLKFQEVVLRAADLSIPKIKVNNSNRRQGNAWWSAECEEAVKNKKHKYKSYIKNKSEENHAAMKVAKNLCNRTINNAKKTY